MQIRILNKPDSVFLVTKPCYISMVKKKKITVAARL